MILHTVNKSPFYNNSFIECLRFCSKGDSLLLIEDGIYAAQDDTEYAELIASNRTINFYALKADVLARGIGSQINEQIKLVDDQGFVELVVQHKSVQSWY